jgi:hypothetical protein
MLDGRRDRGRRRLVDQPPGCRGLAHAHDDGPDRDAVAEPDPQEGTQPLADPDAEAQAPSDGSERVLPVRLPVALLRGLLRP